MKQSALIRILKLLKPKKKLVVGLLVLIIFAVAFDIAVLFISQRLIDSLVQFFKNGVAAPRNLLIFSALAVLVLTVLNRILRSVYDYRLFMMVTGVEDEIAHEAFEKYLRLHALFHHGTSSGQMIGRIDRGGSSVFAILHDIIGQNLLGPSIILIGTFGILLFKNVWIALAVFLPLPIYLIIIQSLAKKIYEIEKKANDEFEAVSKEAYDVAGNVLTVKKFSQERAETEEQARLQARARATQYGSERLWGIIENTQTFIATIGRISVILIAGFLVIRGTSTVGEFVLFMSLQGMCYAPMASLSVLFPRLRRNTSRAERLFEILDEPIHVVDKSDAVVLPSLEKSIEFRNVSFRYSPERPWASRNLNVLVPAKTTVALVGRSGSGKTTFINLLLRSYDPEKGAILIDGHDVRDVTQESLRNQIAVVPQEVDLFSRTIKQNIAYGKPGISDKEIVRAAKTALAHDFIMKTEHGYDTVIGERGIKLSGGERQRVGIARAVLRDPRILVLDEATSHLDTESEQLIQQATNNLIKNRTSFIIAHRFSTILHADMILVFKDGAIETVGKHKELLKKSATYKRLYALQFSDAPTGADSLKEEVALLSA